MGKIRATHHIHLEASLASLSMRAGILLREGSAIEARWVVEVAIKDASRKWGVAERVVWWKATVSRIRQCEGRVAADVRCERSGAKEQATMKSHLSEDVYGICAQMEVP